MSTSQEVQPAEKSANKAIDELQKVTGILTSNINELEKSMGNILRPSDISPEEEESATKPVSYCGLTDAIITEIKQIVGAAKQVSSLNTRLEA